MTPEEELLEEIEAQISYLRTTKLRIKDGMSVQNAVDHIRRKDTVFMTNIRRIDVLTQGNVPINRLVERWGVSSGIISQIRNRR